MDALQIIIPGHMRPRPAPAAAESHDQSEQRRAVERELRARAAQRREREQRAQHSADDHLEEAKSLLAQCGGDLQAALSELLRKYASNGHHSGPTGLRADHPTLEYSGHEGRILGIR